MTNTNNTTSPIVPVLGMGATILGWTDRYPATVIAISKSGRVITVQDDIYTRIDSNGMSECQDYTYTANPNGCTKTYSLRKNGRWVQKGTKDCYLSLGNRRRYYDYSF